ncbi:MAG: ATP-binding protein [Betaproteobacteria bacterium]|nr:ATP-binding protein [Betaproteobacteria bacterium]
MDWVSYVWSVTAGICLTFGGIHLFLWTASRQSWANLAFAISALAAAGYTTLELFQLRAATPHEYVEYARWTLALGTAVALGLVAFIRLYLQAGRLWLLWLICGVRALILVLNFAAEPNFYFAEIIDLRTISLLGQRVVAPVGEASPWALLPQLSHVLIIIFVLDAARTAANAGGRTGPWLTGGAIAVAVALAGLSVALRSRGLLPGAFVGQFMLLPIGVMGYRLSLDLYRAGRFARSLGESEARLRVAAHAASLGLWEWDMRRDIVWANDAARAHVRTGETAAAGIERFVQSVHPDDRESVREALGRSAQTGAEYGVEFRAINATGATVWLAARGQAEIGEDGKPVRLLGIVQDITERKVAEAELELQRAELAHVQRVSTMGYLASALAHELSQPLAAILRNAEAGELFLRHEPPEVDELRPILEDIQRDEQRAAGVIDRIRLLLKHRRLEYEPLDVGELVEQTMALARPETLARRVVPQIDIAPALPSVLGDRVQLQQVLLNLVTNALDAMDPRPIERRRLIVTVRRAVHDGAEVTVADTGSGIPAEQLSRVFEPFITTKSSGLGMGLALSKMIVEAHGGRIWAENNTAGGANIRFTILNATAERRTAA